ATLGVAVERFAYRPLRRASRLAPLIAALGVSMLLQNTVMLATGGRAKTYLTSAIISPDAGIDLGGTFVSFLRLGVVVVAALFMLALDYTVRHTYTGKAMRAVAEDPEAAAWAGVSVNRVVVAAFLLGSLLAGAGGVMVGLLYTQIDFYMGFSAGMKAFTACVLGGIGNLHGAMAGGVVLGLLESLGVAFVSPVYRDVIAFSLLILTLLLRPEGILGRARGQRA
ncbi:MAG: branched-chain amino acid ABC transporter permease, partial [Bacillota bacterium]